MSNITGIQWAHGVKAAQNIEKFQRIKHKQTEARNGAYDPRMSVLRAREVDDKLEHHNIEKGLVANAILIQLKISSLTDVLYNVLHIPSKHGFNNWKTGFVGKLQIIRR